MLITQIDVQLNANAFKIKVNGYTKNIDANPLTAISQSLSPIVISETSIINPANTNNNTTANTGQTMIALNKAKNVNGLPRTNCIIKTKIPPIKPHKNARNIASSILPSATILLKKYFGLKNISVKRLNQFLFFDFMQTPPLV